MFQVLHCAPKHCLVAASASHRWGVLRREGRVLPPAEWKPRAEPPCPGGVAASEAAGRGGAALSPRSPPLVPAHPRTAEPQPARVSEPLHHLGREMSS